MLQRRLEFLFFNKICLKNKKQALSFLKIRLIQVSKDTLWKGIIKNLIMAEKVIQIYQEKFSN